MSMFPAEPLFVLIAEAEYRSIARCPAETLRASIAVEVTMPMRAAEQTNSRVIRAFSFAEPSFKLRATCRRERRRVGYKRTPVFALSIRFELNGISAGRG